MKIERLNENQIRCTLNKEDLANREIKLSELAYGSDKAKRLFRDMMIQASTEVGFEANDIPLVIEAIPVSNECIILMLQRLKTLKSWIPVFQNSLRRTYLSRTQHRSLARIPTIILPVIAARRIFWTCLKRSARN